MGHGITAINRYGTNIAIQVDKYPDECPICHIGIETQRLQYYLSGTRDLFSSFEMLCRCPRHECGKVFLAIYKPYPLGSAVFLYSKSVPCEHKATLVHDSIKKISPSFYTIYSQAEHAETLGLKEICGTGYRKALEFLIKDFVLSDKDNPKIKPDVIKPMALSACIENYMDDNKTKQLAKRAAWLGNDETHYYRKWDDKELDDLKKLIHLTMNAIDNEIVAYEYMKDMNTPK